MGEDVVGDFRGAPKELYRLSSCKRPIHEEQISGDTVIPRTALSTEYYGRSVWVYHTSLMTRLIMLPSACSWCGAGATLSSESVFVKD
jgi:hypothetical protein